MGLNVRIRHLKGTTSADLPARPIERPVVIGRSAAADVRVTAFTPGDDHCAIFIKDRRWHVVDLFGAGQVLVNGVAADEPTLLKAGDVIAIGEGPDAPVVEVVGSGASTRPAERPAASQPNPPYPAQPIQPAAAYAAPAYAAPAAEPAAQADPDAIDFGGTDAGPATSYVRRRPKKNSATPMIVGVSIAVLLAAGAGLWLLKQKKPAIPAGPAPVAATPNAPAAVNAPLAAAPLPDAAEGGSPTPLAALRAYAAAMEAGKPTGVRRVVAGDDKRHGAVYTFMRFSFVVRNLEDAAVKRFGPAGRGTGALAGPLLTDAAADPTLAEAVTGNTATVGRPGSAERLPFVKGVGGWRFDLATAFPDPAALHPAERYIENVLPVLAQLTEDVAAGKKFASAEDVKSRVREEVAKLRTRYPKDSAAADRVVFAVGGPDRVAVAQAESPAAVAPTPPAPTPAAPPPAAETPTPTPPSPPPPPDRPEFKQVKPDEDRVRFPGDEPPKRLVFVVDYATPAMADALPINKQELTKTIVNLRSTQQFQIVVPAAKGQPPQTSAPALTAADADGKKSGIGFVDEIKSLKAGTRTDLIAAVESAAGQKPDLLYILVGSDRTDVPALAKRMIAINPGGRMKVNTILFVNTPLKGTKAEDEMIEALESIAKASKGGKFTQVKVEAME